MAYEAADFSLRTSSKNGNFYFAYGSNLSPEQMEGRCVNSPQKAGKPVAIARLDGWKWIICTRGYANVVKLLDVESDRYPTASPQNAVWGVVYNLESTDESELDRYEGSSAFYEQFPEVNPDPASRPERPHLQGNRLYNKLYLPVTVEKWLDSPQSYGLTPEDEEKPITILIYVDEKRLEEGSIQSSYIGRMNRAIDQSVPLGVSPRWIKDMMRKWVPEGVEVDKNGFVGSVPGHESSWTDTEVNSNEEGAWDQGAEREVGKW